MKRCLLIFTIGFLLASCSSLNFLTIDVRKPAQVTVPISVGNIIVVNNSAVQPEDVGHKDVMYSNESVIDVSSDNLNIILTQALAQFMNEEQFFNNVDIYNENLGASYSFLSEIPLEKERIQNILAETGGDAVLSLDRLIMKSTKNTSNIGNGLQADNLKVKIDGRLRLYSDEGKLLVPLISYRDSIAWECVRDGDFYLSEPIPDRKETLENASLYAADQLVSMFIPHWTQQNRWYYTDGNTKMKEASVKAAGNDWAKAALIWGEIYESEKKPRKKAKLASNITLANEMIDDLDNALKWADISYDLFKSTSKKTGENVDVDLLRISIYREELKQRILDYKILDIQDNADLDAEGSDED